MVRACNFLRYFYVYLRHLLNIPIPDNYVFVFPKYIRFCKIYSWMSCQENKPMLYYAYSKNKFVILNEIFFQTDLHLSKIEKLYTLSQICHMNNFHTKGSRSPEPSMNISPSYWQFLVCSENRFFIASVFLFLDLNISKQCPLNNQDNMKNQLQHRTF